MAGQGPDTAGLDVQPQLPAGSGQAVRGTRLPGPWWSRNGPDQAGDAVREQEGQGGTGAPQGGDPTGCERCVLLFRH